MFKNGFASWVEAWTTTGNYMSILTTVASPASRKDISISVVSFFVSLTVFENRWLDHLEVKRPF